jgi:hypothetical protein
LPMLAIGLRINPYEYRCETVKVPREFIERLTEAVCYAA